MTLVTVHHKICSFHALLHANDLKNITYYLICMYLINCPSHLISTSTCIIYIVLRKKNIACCFWISTIKLHRVRDYSFTCERTTTRPSASETLAGAFERFCGGYVKTPTKKPVLNTPNSILNQLRQWP